MAEGPHSRWHPKNTGTVVPLRYDGLLSVARLLRASVGRPCLDGAGRRVIIGHSFSALARPGRRAASGALPKPVADKQAAALAREWSAMEMTALPFRLCPRRKHSTSASRCWPRKGANARIIAGGQFR